MDKKIFKASYEILGGPNATDGVVTKRLRAFSKYNAEQWVTKQADGHDYTLLWVLEVAA